MAADPITAATAAVVSYGADIHIGYPADKVAIPGVTEIQSYTVDEGYETKEEYPDEVGNIGTTVFSGYSQTISFTGLVKKGQTTMPYKGMALTLSDLEENDYAYIDTLSVAYGPRAAQVSGTVKIVRKLAKPTIGS